MQRMRDTEKREEEQRRALDKKKVRSQVWRAKNQDPEQDGSSGAAADVNMVFMLPRDFMALVSDEELSDVE